MPDGAWDKWRIYPAPDAEFEPLDYRKPGDVVMLKTTSRLVTLRTAPLSAEKDYLVEDVLTGVEVYVKASELEMSTTYNAMEVIAWTSTQ